jgi:hypothetical protein
VSPALVEEFAQGLLADNAVIALKVQSGDRLELTELVELAAATRALYNTATLASREFGRMDQCYALWAATAQVFEQLRAAWDSVPADGELVSFHRAQLERLCELALDRVELYRSNGPDRRRGC